MTSLRLADPAGDFRQALVPLLPSLRAFARFLAHDPSRADDLVQETVLRALAAEQQWQPGTELRAWCFRILRNAHLEHGRRRASETRALGRLDRDATARASQQDAADLGDLDRAMRGLPEGQREALILVSAHGFSIEEAAEVCGVAPGTIKARISRARVTLARRYHGG
ncbi:MAG TPA: sigma-70 family RNA polymerase sigma factor [Roseomonas sp.]